MGVIIAHGTGTEGEQLRQMVLNAGLSCENADTVPLDQLEVRLPQVMADMALIAFGNETEAGIKAVDKAAEQTTVPILALGPTEDSQLVMRALRAGAREFLDAADPINELEAALDKLALTDEDSRIRGNVISVYSPTSGSGSTTIACNLAAALGRTHAGDVALVELSRRDGDVALYYDIDPDYTVANACERCEHLDAISLGAGMVEHETGVSVLAHDPEEIHRELMTPDSIRRIAVLLRSMFRFTIFDLDSRLEPEQLEAMKIADHVATVIRPDVPAVRRAQRTIDGVIDLGVRADRVRLIINRWGQSGQLPLRSIADILELEPFQLIPDDPRRVNNAVNQGVLLNQLSRGAPITRRFAQLATQLDVDD